MKGLVKHRRHYRSSRDTFGGRKRCTDYPVNRKGCRRCSPHGQYECSITELSQPMHFTADFHGLYFVHGYGLECMGLCVPFESWLGARAAPSLELVMFSAREGRTSSLYSLVSGLWSWIPTTMNYHSGPGHVPQHLLIPDASSATVGTNALLDSASCNRPKGLDRVRKFKSLQCEGREVGG